MKKTFVLALSLIIISVTAFAHGGHNHSYLGTVKSVSSEQLTIVTRSGDDASFVLTSKTAYTRAGKTARHSDLVSGVRVAVHVAEDGKTVTSVKLANR